jgi:hypothetical protein
MPQDMLIEPLTAVVVFSGLVIAGCVIGLACALGYDRGHARAGAATTEALRKLRAEVAAARASYAWPWPREDGR